MTLGLIQLFNYFDMDMKTRVISAEARKTVETEKSYPLTIEEVRRMYAVADSLRDKVILLLGKDVGLRLADVLSIKRDEIPDLDQEAPIPFQRVTAKEKVLARGFGGLSWNVKGSKRCTCVEGESSLTNVLKAQSPALSIQRLLS